MTSFKRNGKISKIFKHKGIIIKQPTFSKKDDSLLYPLITEAAVKLKGSPLIAICNYRKGSATLAEKRKAEKLIMQVKDFDRKFKRMMSYFNFFGILEMMDHEKMPEEEAENYILDFYKLEKREYGKLEKLLYYYVLELKKEYERQNRIKTRHYSFKPETWYKDLVSADRDFTAEFGYHPNVIQFQEKTWEKMKTLMNNFQSEVLELSVKENAPILKNAPIDDFSMFVFNDPATGINLLLTINGLLKEKDFHLCFLPMGSAYDN